MNNTAIISLLREGYALCDALEDHAGVYPTAETDEIRKRLDYVAFGELDMSEAEYFRLIAGE